MERGRGWGIRLCHLGQKGFGLVAGIPIPAQSPILTNPAKRFGFSNQEVNWELGKYLFSRPNETVLVLGLITMLNHSELPNAVVEWKEDEGLLFATLVSTMDIGEGEEIQSNTLI